MSWLGCKYFALLPFILLLLNLMRVHNPKLEPGQLDPPPISLDSMWPGPLGFLGCLPCMQAMPGATGTRQLLNRTSVSVPQSLTPAFELAYAYNSRAFELPWLRNTQKNTTEITKKPKKN
jgi:hypothetical protein